MNRNVFFAILVVLISIGTFLPLLHSGFFEFHDNTQVVRVYEMGKMLMQGTFPVRWVPDLGYGYGYPIFNFYAPFSYYVGGIFNILGFDALISTKLMFFVGIILAPLIMYFSLRQIFDERASLVGAVIYAYFPYHAVNIFVRGAVSEFYAYSFLPLVFLGAAKLIGAKDLRSQLVNLLFVIFGIFLVAISHNLTLIMTGAILIPIALICFFIARKKGVFITAIFGAVISGLLLASFYAVPAFLEMNQTNVISQIGGGADYRDHFVCVSQFWNSMWGFGGSVEGCLDGLSFRLGKLNIILAIIALLAIILKVKKGKLKLQDYVAILSFAGLVFSLFMVLDLSKLLWKSVFLFEYIQYPWRFINFISLFISILVSYLVFIVCQKFGKGVAYTVITLIIVLTVAINGKLFVPQFYIANNSASYVNIDTIKFKVSKISDEYLPYGFAIPQSIEDLPKKEGEILKSDGRLDFERVKHDRYNIHYFLEKDGVIQINKAYFPTWKAMVNGYDIPIIKTTKGMNISIKKGEGVIDLYMTNTPVQTAGDIISLLSFFGMLTAIIVFSRTKKRNG